MTSVFDPTGKQTACTIIEAGPCVVTQVRTKDSDGYSALQLAFGDKNEKHSIKSETNHFAKASTSPKKFVKEFRDFSVEKNIGETITVDIFAEGETVDVVGTYIQEHVDEFRAAHREFRPIGALELEVRMDWRCNAECKFCGVWKYSREGMLPELGAFPQPNPGLNVAVDDGLARL